MLAAVEPEALQSLGHALAAAIALCLIALMTAGTYLVSIAGGVVLLGDGLGRGAATTTLHAAARVVVIAAVYLLAGSQAVLAEEVEAV